MNDLAQDPDYLDARRSARALPTWVLRIWERRASHRLRQGTPLAAERNRLLAVRSVLHEREKNR